MFLTCECVPAKMSLTVESREEDNGRRVVYGFELNGPSSRRKKGRMRIITILRGTLTSLKYKPKKGEDKRQRSEKLKREFEDNPFRVLDSASSIIKTGHINSGKKVRYVIEFTSMFILIQCQVLSIGGLIESFHCIQLQLRPRAFQSQLNIVPSGNWELFFDS